MGNKDEYVWVQMTIGGAIAVDFDENGEAAAIGEPCIKLSSLVSFQEHWLNLNDVIADLQRFTIEAVPPLSVLVPAEV